MSPAEWSRYVEAGIASLNARQRRVIELVHVEGYTLQEVSETIRESLANTRNYYYRGLKALRSFLKAQTGMKQAVESVALEGNDAYRFEH